MRGTLTWLFAPGAFLLLCLAAAQGQAPAAESLPARGQALMAELGCASCHSELRLDTSLRERTPDLGSAGLRYRPSWLFEFLRNPVRIRQHLGRARMPEFHLSEKETLALVAFLETQRTVPGQWPPLPEAVIRQSNAPIASIRRDQIQAELSRGLLCLTCHKFDGKGGVLGIELSTVAHRLQPDWVRQYLVAPTRFGVSPAVMPPQFYQPAADGKSYRELAPGAAERIGRLVDHLCSGISSTRSDLDRKYEAARAAAPDANAASGEKLFVALNCAACHRHPTIAPHPSPAAPDLTREGWRVNETWLANYLKHPQPIRPFGHRPGDGSRMPDFRLSDEEATAIRAFLLTQNADSKRVSAGIPLAPLSEFSQNKARLLLTEKLSCLGCHELDERGGRVGPRLSAAGTRLRPDYILGIIQNPSAIAPHSIMPRLPLPDDTARLIANYLLLQTNSIAPARYLSPLNYSLLPLGETNAGNATIRQTYFTHCAVCHGLDGRGDGFNAKFLPTKPTAHANAAYLATRPDDTLYDGIHAGGYILNKSHLMPPWGETLSPKQIQELVGFLRTLCQCEGPPWSRDGAKNP